MCARARSCRIVGITCGVGVIVEPKRRSSAETDNFFSTGRDSVVDDDGEEWKIMDGIMPWGSRPD